MKRLIALLALALLACLPSAGFAQADDTLTVVGGATPTAAFEVLDDVAEYAGFFKQQHLHVDKQYAGTAPNAAQIVATGKADIMTGSFEPVIVGYEKGVRLQFFLARSPRYSYLVAVPAESPIKTLADFKGANLGEVNAGAAIEMVANAMFEGAGLHKGDVSYTPIGVGNAALAAIASKRVDGVAFPYVELVTDEVVGHMAFRLFRAPLFNDVANVGYAATPATIQTKGDLLARYARAIVEASIFTRENPRVAARYFLEGAGLKVTDEALAIETQELMTFRDDLDGADPGSKRIGLMSPHGVDIYSRFLTDNGVIKSVVPAAEIVTDKFIPYANDFDHNALIAAAKAAR
jgi:NitT/TauT family transport system substrate-binding protein